MPDKKPKRFGYREEVLEALLKLLAPYEDVTRDNMFGFPAFRASGQIFACVYENGISLKMPKAAAEAIVQSPGISPFIPFGRARMRQWVHIERKKTSAYIKDFPLIEASIHYVRTLKPKKGAKKTPTSDSAPKKSTPPPAARPAAAGKSKSAAKTPAGTAAKKSAPSKGTAAKSNKKAPAKKAAKAAPQPKSQPASARTKAVKKAAKKSPAKKPASPKRKTAKKSAARPTRKASSRGRK